MAAIDYERVVLAMKAHIVSKRSHGQQELLAKLAEYEVQYAVPEGQDLYDERPTPISARS